MALADCAAAVSLHRRNPRRDGNEAAIRQALEAQGFCVMPISGTGIPDLVVSQPAGTRPYPRVWLVEVKQPKGTFKPAQMAWREKWGGAVPITLRTIEDCQRFMLLAMEGGQS
jgi:hypothetical protein